MRDINTNYLLKNDNIDLKNVSGTILVKDEAVNLKDIKSDVFGGNIGFTGKVSTKGDTSNFDMDLNLKELNTMILLTK